MTIADSRVVLSEFFAGKRNSVGDYWPPCMAKEAHQALLAEAEREVARLESSVFNVVTERNALQSRLDAVVVDMREAIADVVRSGGFINSDEVIGWANELRAALGCATTGEMK